MKLSQTLNLTLLGTLSMITSQVSFAQTVAQPVNVEQINQTAADQAANINIENTHSGKKVLGRIGKHITEGLNPKFSRSIPKSRTLNSDERPKVALLKCVEKMLEQNNGAANAPVVAFDVLMSAMDHNGWSHNADQIQNAVDQCQSLRHEIKTYPNSKVDQNLRGQSLDNIAVVNAASQKVKTLIAALENPSTLQCQVSTYAVTAGALVMAKVGISSAKCLWSNGKVFKFFGPAIELVFGVGVDFLQDRYILQDEKMSRHSPLHVFSNSALLTHGQSQSASGPGLPMTGYVVTGIGSIYGKEYGTLDENVEQGVAVGLSRRGGIGGPGFLIRFFNGPRNWGMLIDQLN